MDGVDGLEIAFDPTDLTFANHKRGQERQKHVTDFKGVHLNKSITLIELNTELRMRRKTPPKTTHFQLSLISTS